MLDFFGRLFDTAGFTSRATGEGLTGELVGIQSLADSLIGLAFLALLILLFFCAWSSRNALPIDRVVWLVGAFLVACSWMQFVDVASYYIPFYRFVALVKTITAVVCWATVIALIRSGPRTLFDARSVSSTRPSAQEQWEALQEESRQRRLIQEELRDSENRFRLLAEAIPHMVWTANPAGEMVYSNQRWADYTGLSKEAVKGKGWQQVIHPDDHEQGIRQWQAAVERGNLLEVEQRLRRSDGAYRWHLVRGLPLRGESGAIEQWVGTITDIDDRRREKETLEQLVRERTFELTATNEALQRSNRELEQFAYVASHDLQEPLRKIQAFGDRLQRHCSKELSEQAADYLTRILASATRMRRLIEDLLSFSRVAIRPQALMPVNLAEIVQEVVSDLEERLQQTGGRVDIGELPTVEADAVQMRQLFQNLLGNALKFHRAEEPPLVQVRATLLETNEPVEESSSTRNWWEITVRDNGIGFEETYVDRIFEVFQRLHGRGEYEGTGVGLAICRKIVERHGGQITARSCPGRGSTFIIRLPAIQSRMDRLLATVDMNDSKVRQ